MTLKCVNGIKNGTNKVSMGYRKCQWYHRVAIITEEDTVRYGTVRYGTVKCQWNFLVSKVVLKMCQWYQKWY